MSDSTKANLFLCRFWGLTVGAIKTAALFSFIFLLNLAYLAPADAAICFLPDGTEDCDGLNLNNSTGDTGEQPSCSEDYKYTSDYTATGCWTCDKCDDKYKCQKKSDSTTCPTGKYSIADCGTHQDGWKFTTTNSFAYLDNGIPKCKDCGKCKAKTCAEQLPGSAVKAADSSGNCPSTYRTPKSGEPQKYSGDNLCCLKDTCLDHSFYESDQSDKDCTEVHANGLTCYSCTDKIASCEDEEDENGKKVYHTNASACTDAGKEAQPTTVNGKQCYKCVDSAEPGNCSVLGEKWIENTNYETPDGTDDYDFVNYLKHEKPYLLGPLNYSKPYNLNYGQCVRELTCADVRYRRVNPKGGAGGASPSKELKVSFNDLTNTYISIDRKDVRFAGAKDVAFKGLHDDYNTGLEGEKCKCTWTNEEGVDESCCDWLTCPVYTCEDLGYKSNYTDCNVNDRDNEGKRELYYRVDLPNYFLSCYECKRPQACSELGEGWITHEEFDNLGWEWLEQFSAYDDTKKEYIAYFVQVGGLTRDVEGGEVSYGDFECYKVVFISKYETGADDDILLSPDEETICTNRAIPEERSIMADLKGFHYDNKDYLNTYYYNSFPLIINNVEGYQSNTIVKRFHYDYYEHSFRVDEGYRNVFDLDGYHLCRCEDHNLKSATDDCADDEFAVKSKDYDCYECVCGMHCTPSGAQSCSDTTYGWHTPLAAGCTNYDTTTIGELTYYCCKDSASSSDPYYDIHGSCKTCCAEEVGTNAVVEDIHGALGDTKDITESYIIRDNENKSSHDYNCANFICDCDNCHGTFPRSCMDEGD